MCKEVGAIPLKTRLVDIERFASGDARELNGAQHVALVLVVADDAADAGQRRLHGLVGALLDQRQVLGVGRRSAAVVTGLLDEHFLGLQQLGELAAEPLAPCC